MGLQAVSIGLLVLGMPHATVPGYQYIQVSELAPTFGAEVSGIDFSKPVPPEVFQEISDASAKVCYFIHATAVVARV